MRPRLATVLFACLLAACGSTPPAVAPLAPAAPPVSRPLAIATVPEAYVSTDVGGEELDSIATWTGEDDRTWLVATAKTTHRLLVFDADTGEVLQRVGGRGAAPGQFERPNGVAVYGDLLFVVERDNHRVQVLQLPGFEPVASFGARELRKPYGLWLHERAPGELDVYVTDSYMDGARFDVVPPADQLGERVRRYRVEVGDDGGIDARHLGAFGDIAGPGVLRMVESIAGDPVHRRLLIADEFRPSPSNLREYDFDGRYTQRGLPDGTFQGEAEGVALWACAEDSGYWVAVDQQAPLTTFHLFERSSLRPAGSFAGTVTAQTDGIALHAAATARFPAGALFAVHDDRAVAAFDLRDVAAALRLDETCAP